MGKVTDFGNTQVSVFPAVQMAVMYSSDKAFWLCHCHISHYSEMLTVTLNSKIKGLLYLKLYVHFYGNGKEKRKEKEENDKGGG